MRRIGLVGSGEQGLAALEWLQAQKIVSVLHRGRCDALPLASLDVVWVHGSTQPFRGLVPWLEAGGRLLATLGGTILPFSLGLETVPPDEWREGVWHDAEDEFYFEEFHSFKAFPHLRGFGAFGPHPLFAGLDQGTYTWAPAEGEPYHWRAYRAARPAAAAVVAVERSFIHLNPERVVAWEYTVGEGGILCLGAFTFLGTPDPLLRRQLHAVLSNALKGDAIPHHSRPSRVATWPAAATGHPRRVEDPVPEVPDCGDPWVPSASLIAIKSTATEDDPWTLGGRRMLLTGGERSGLWEAWSHPFRVLRQASILVDGKTPGFQNATIGPDEIYRGLDAGATGAAESWTTALDQPILLWDIHAGEGELVEARWQVDFRRMWPYPSGCYGDLRWNLSESGTRARIGVAGAQVQVVIAVDGPSASIAIEPAGSELAIHCRAEARLRVVIVAAADGADLQRTLSTLERRRVTGLRGQRGRHAEQLRMHGAAVECPDPNLPLAVEWAKVRMDSFFAETPGLGRSLLAGYAASRPGWGDGRPGYAWYFGRDACWTAFAQLAAGDRDAPRDVLRFLSETQDVTGKVLHEYTTSGLVHYDAADSTPLYLLLAARYAAWTGDLAHLEKYWPAIEQAYRFCLETDTDGDGLIENQRVGHGWIEHGPLGGAAVTLYLAACWVAALEGLVPVARAMRKNDLATELEARAATARQTVSDRFRLDGDYALGLRADGTPQRHRTAMLGVPLLLGLVAPGEVPGWYDDIAGEGFSAPWGVRMISRHDPLFEPTGYHLGAIWPLYTGWVSLAEWKGGRHEAALAHLLANAGLVQERAKGAFDEVLHGLERRAAGICPDQAWSAAMVISPAIEGLWGVVPDALNEAVTIAPWLPGNWPGMALRRLRVGKTAIDVEVRRNPGGLIVRVNRVAGPGIRVTLAPRGLPPGAAVQLGEETLGSVGRAVFAAESRHEVIFTGSG